MKFSVMQTSVSEKQAFLGLFLLLAGVVVFLNTKVIASPLKVSEKGLFLDLAAVALIITAVRVIAKSIHRA